MPNQNAPLLIKFGHVESAATSGETTIQLRSVRRRSDDLLVPVAGPLLATKPKSWPEAARTPVRHNSPMFVIQSATVDDPHVTPYVCNFPLFLRLNVTLIRQNRKRLWAEYSTILS